MKPLRVMSLFDGISAGQVALERAGIPVEVYYASEIDKYAIQITQKNYPNTIHLGDVEKIDFTQFEGKIDLLIGGSPCFVADTLVMTEYGFKSIQDIKVGDYVLTHKSRYRKVLNVGSKLVDRLYKIKGLGFDEIITTEEHPFYVREMYRKWNVKRRSLDRLFTSPEWIKTKDLHKNHYLSSTFNIESKNGFNVYTTDFWYFVGRFTGDGWVRQTKRKYRKNSYIYQVLICCGKNEKDELKEIFDKVGYNYNFSEERTTYKFRICNEKLVRFLMQSGIGAKNKIVHPMLWNLPIEFKKAFLEGYMSADGYFDETKNSFSATTISRELAYGIKQLAMEVYNTCPKIYFVKTKQKKVLEGRIINQQNQYIVRFCLSKNKQDKAFFENNISWQPYKSTEILNTPSIVYNLEVEEDNSYTANTIIVHNCTNLSIAGNRKGLEGDESRLFWEYARAIKECKPKYFLLENVESMSNSDKEIISKELGCYPICINSSLLSAQNRKRYYWFNWGNKEYNLFGFPTCSIPQPKDKGIFLKDVLESELPYQNKSDCLTTRYQGATFPHDFLRNQEPIGVDVVNNGTEIKGILNKSHTLLARDYKGWNTYGMTGVAEPICVNSQSGRADGLAKQPSCADRIYSIEGKSVALASGWKQNIAEPVGYIEKHLQSLSDKLGYVPTQFNAYNEKEIVEKSPTLTCYSGSQTSTSAVNIFIPIRLQEYEQSKGQAQRVYSVRGKSVTLNANGGGQGGKTGLYKIDLPDGDYVIRKLTPIECERLQTFDDGYTSGISNTQRYKCIGNSWTVDVISYIFSFLESE